MPFSLSRKTSSDNMGANQQSKPYSAPAKPKNQQCNEFFHTQHPWHSNKKTRVCQSTLHKTHNVCTECHDRAHTFLTMQQKHVEEHGVAAELCPDCTSKAIETYGEKHDSCTCFFGKKQEEHDQWHCFECRQMLLWSACMVANNWCHFEHVELKEKKTCEKEDRYVGVKKCSAVCPKCRECFNDKETRKKRVDARGCLTCEGVLITPLVDEQEGDGEKTERRESILETSPTRSSAATATPPFTLPDWTVQVTGLRRPTVDLNEDLAPDELPRTLNRVDSVVPARVCGEDQNASSAQLDHAFSSKGSDLTPPQPENTLTDQTLQPHPSLSRKTSGTIPSRRPLEWNFPRHPAQTPYDDHYKPPSSPPSKHTLEELVEIRGMAEGRRYQFRQYDRCWNCGRDNHSWEKCNRPDVMSSLDKEIEGREKEEELEKEIGSFSRADQVVKHWGQKFNFWTFNIGK